MLRNGVRILLDNGHSVQRATNYYAHEFFLNSSQSQTLQSVLHVLLPYCFGTYVVLNKSYPKNFRARLQSVNFIIFQSLHSMPPMSFA